MPFTSSSTTFGLDPALRELADRELEGVDLRDVDRRETAPDDDGAGKHLVARARQVAALGVVERDHEGILVDETLAEIGVGTLDRKRPIAPGAVREHDRREAPFLRELGKRDVAADLRVRDELDSGPRELLVDRRVLLLAQRLVPARKPVLDLAVGSLVLFEHDDRDAPVREPARDLRARRRPTDHRHTMLSIRLRHARHSGSSNRG